MEEGVVAKWRVDVGDKVKRGQIIAEIETDKATMEFESFDSGHVLKLVAEVGETLPIGAAIAVLGKQDEDPSEALAAFEGPSSGGEGEGEAEAPAPKAEPEGRGKQEGKGKAQAEVEAKREAPAAATPVTLDPDSERIPASPIARRLAREHGLELASIPGSGPHGRVIKADVDKAVREGVPAGRKAGEAAARAAAPEGASISAEVDAWGRPYVSYPDETVKLSQMRKAIAKRMTASKQEVPHYYLTMEVDMERAASFRAELNASSETIKVSFNDLIVKAVALALREMPAVNSSFEGDHYLRHGDVNVGVAVAIDEGLVVPVIPHADQKSLVAISRETRDLGARARDKQLRPEEMSGGTFTVSNLGMFGIQEFSAVINPGEPGILAVGSIEARPVVVEGASQTEAQAPVIAVRRRMKMTISADHRVTDGAVAARWMGRVRDYLEHPIRLVAGS